MDDYEDLINTNYMKDEGISGEEEMEDDDDGSFMMTDFVQAEMGSQEENDEEFDMPPDLEDQSSEQPSTSTAKHLRNMRPVEKPVRTKIVRGVKMYVCPTCGYDTEVKARITKHIKYHSMPLIKCELCDFKTPYKWNLDRHNKSHNAEGELQCELCTFSCDCKQSLTVHMQNHHAHVPPELQISKKRKKYDDSTTNSGNTSESDSKSAGLSQFMVGLLADNKDITVTVTSGANKPTSSKKVFSSGRGNPHFNGGGHSSSSNNSNHSDSDLILPDDMSDRNGKVFIKKLACRQCDFKCVWDTEMVRHVSRYHGSGKKQKSIAPSLSPAIQYGELSSTSMLKQMPSLIPIQLAMTESVENRERKWEGGESDCDELELTPRKTPPPPTKVVDPDDVDFQEKSKFLFNLALRPNVIWARKPRAAKMLKFSAEEQRGVKRRSGQMEEDNGESDELVGYETSPGFGAIREDNGVDSGMMQPPELTSEDSITTTRKVYRCPMEDCSFWATTASRFHVHMVGHKNLKPFMCSVCNYRSNWRWDISKHIKLKSMRDRSHQSAKTLLTNESGERNYREYDQHLTMLQLQYPANDKPPDCSTLASKRNTKAQLSPPILRRGGMEQKMPKLKRAPPAGDDDGNHAWNNNEEEEDMYPPPPPNLKRIARFSGSEDMGEDQSILAKGMFAGGQMREVKGSVSC